MDKIDIYVFFKKLIATTWAFWTANITTGMSSNTASMSIASTPDALWLNQAYT